MNIILSILSTCYLLASPPSLNSQLCLQVNNISQPEGKIWIAIYDSEQNFLDRDKAILYHYQVDAQPNQKMNLGELPYGEYAMAIFHDKNSNDEFDFNWFGLPEEPFAFSQNLVSKWRKPTFEEVKFIINEQNKVLTLRLNTWQNL